MWYVVNANINQSFGFWRGHRMWRAPTTLPPLALYTRMCLGLINQTHGVLIRFCNMIAEVLRSSPTHASWPALLTLTCHYVDFDHHMSWYDTLPFGLQSPFFYLFDKNFRTCFLLHTEAIFEIEYTTGFSATSYSTWHWFCKHLRLYNSEHFKDPWSSIDQFRIISSPLRPFGPPKVLNSIKQMWELFSHLVGICPPCSKPVHCLPRDNHWREELRIKAHLSWHLSLTVVLNQSRLFFFHFN